MVYTVCYSVYVFWTRFSTVKPRCSNFRMNTTNVLGVRIIRKFTVINLNIDSIKIDKVHNVWPSLESTVLDVRKGIVKCKLLTGTYLHQSNRHKLSQPVVSATCRCCDMEDEDLAHMSVTCKSDRTILFKDQRNGNFIDRRESVEKYIQ